MATDNFGYTLEERGDFEGADLYRADFEDAYSCYTNFSGANLMDSDLRNADFEGSDFRGAKLSGADFDGANLREANLYEADFDGANLRGTKGYEEVSPGLDPSKRLDPFRAGNLVHARYHNTKIDEANYKIMEEEFAKRGMILDRETQDLFDIIETQDFFDSTGSF